MTEKICIVGASGKLGFATLNALLDHRLVQPENIRCTTSSEGGAQRLNPAREKGAEIISANWDSDESTWIQALEGCSKLFLISSARIAKDFHEAPYGRGREEDHFKVLSAAEKAGIQHVYYTSLAFANPSASRVMTAHERTEEWLHSSGIPYTIIREGLYNESWPLYLGHYDISNDDRSELVVASDSKISWTSIPDLGLASALILSSPSADWMSKTCYLSQSQAYTMTEVAEMISKARGKDTRLHIVGRDEHERYYIQSRGMEKGFIEWWSKTYDALNNNECLIDDPTLERLLAVIGFKPKPMNETVHEMFQEQKGFTGR